MFNLPHMHIFVGGGGGGTKLTQDTGTPHYEYMAKTYDQVKTMGQDCHVTEARWYSIN